MVQRINRASMRTEFRSPNTYITAGGQSGPHQRPVLGKEAG